MQPFSVIWCSFVVYEADVSYCFIFFFCERNELKRQMHYICACVCVFVCVCMRRTTWQALCATSVSPASSTYQRPTPRAVCAVSAWASPSSAPAPLGIEIRSVAKRLMAKGGLDIFGIKV